MLHDLIYALSGHPGNVFKETSVGNFEVVAGLPYISPNEEAALNRLLILGTRFMYFQKFMKAHTSTLYSHSVSGAVVADGLRQGCYLKAFCHGLQKVLSGYQHCLLEIEKEILADPHLSLLYIQCQTDKYHVLFDTLADLIATIKSRRNHGCQILNVLHMQSRSGNMFVKECILEIMYHCHAVMYKQLGSWLLHGLLTDRHSEFFISKKSIQNPSFPEYSGAGVKLMERFTKPEKHEFEVSFEYLPAYIPPSTAHVICFIGSSLHLFQADKQDFCWDVVNQDSRLAKIQSLSKDNDFKLAGILHDRESEFLNDILKLQLAKEFIVKDFEMCMDKIRCAVAKELWTLCIEQAQLVSYLNMLKDFYLLGRGELFLVFIDEAAPILKNPPSRVTEHDVQQAFLRSAAKVQIEDEMPFQLFHLTIKSTSQDKSQPSPFINVNTVDDGWAHLGMSFKVKWPLHTIFKPNILEKYDHLFKFLLRVRRVQSALLRLWSVQMRKQQDIDIANDNLLIPSHEISAFERLQWKCRSEMQFFVDNLQYYLQADVLESHFTNLINKIRTTDETMKDFESIITAHENFLNALLSQCFVMSSAVCTSLIEILDLCQKFCNVVITSSLLVSKEDVFSQVSKIWETYNKKTFVFFQVLNGVCTNQCNPHIAQLTLRLDYNRFYSAMISKSKEATKSLF
ncbi:gamma-tubulin complex component 4-like [Clavelina lepadiformis]|uniref:gamma-tubulin complex component 4-like n=1 Tax=Clavelina lepadiformis TaxID=159417 RepID=UPI0040439061